MAAMRHVRTTRLVVALFVAFGLLSAQPAPAQEAEPQPPPAVVAEAHRIAAALGMQLPPEAPSFVFREESARHTGHPLWKLQWNRCPDINVYITVDEQTLRVVKFRDSAALHEVVSRHKAGEVPVITEAQATAVFQQLGAALPLPPRDWRLYPPSLDRLPPDEGLPPDTGFPYWAFALWGHALDRPVALAHLLADVDAFTGKVLSFSFDNSAVLLPPDGPLLTREQAEPAAVQAFVQYAGPQLRPEDPTAPVARGSGTWEPLHNGTPLSRITYRYIFSISAIPGPTEEDDGERWEQEIWVDVDAETGEVLAAANVLASGPPPGKAGKIKVSPRMSLIWKLVASSPAPAAPARAGRPVEPPRPLLAALFGGRATPAAVPTRGARQFHYPAAGGSVSFRYDAGRRQIFWQQKKGSWARAQLSRARGKELEGWLDATFRPSPAGKVPAAGQQKRHRRPAGTSRRRRSTPSAGRRTSRS